MKRVRLLAALGVVTMYAGCVDAFVPPDRVSDHATVFDQVWADVDRRYSFFELKRIDWDSLRTVYRPLALAATTDRELALVLGRLLAELRDVHVSITAFGPGSTLRYVSRWDTTATYFSAQRVVVAYVKHPAFGSGHHVLFGMMSADGVGYIRIGNFHGTGWASELDDALARLAGASSLIVDVRDNPGGSRGLAIAAAGRFTTRDRRFGYLRMRNGPGHADFTDYLPQVVRPAGRVFTGPVFVLTNRRDFSSAEDFVLAMRAQPQVTVIGDTTAGASGGPAVRQLSKGWRYEISEWIAYTAERRAFEGVGLAPDVVVKMHASDATLGHDPVIEEALALAVPASGTGRRSLRPRG